MVKRSNYRGPMPNWVFLGEGTYNKVYKSDDGKEVLKVHKNLGDYDTPSRSVRLWNAINSHIQPPARIVASKYGLGWVCPFIEGNEASDEEMASALIDIFNKTGRIVVDATAPKNFIKTPQGQVVCIDVGMALQFEKRDNNRIAHIRRKSIISLKGWKELETEYKPFFKTCSGKFPKAVETVKALIFIKNNRPDIFDVNFLKDYPGLVTKLALAYDTINQPSTLEQLDRTSNPVIFAIPKDKAISELQKFTQFLGKHKPALLISANQVQDMRLSGIYNNPKNNKAYINFEIINPEVVDLFKQYILEQKQLAEVRLEQELSRLSPDEKYNRLLAEVSGVFDKDRVHFTGSKEKQLFQQGRNVLNEIKKISQNNLEDTEYLKNVLLYIKKTWKDRANKGLSIQNAQELAYLSQQASGQSSPAWKALGISLLTFACLALVAIGVLAAIPSGGTSLLLSAIGTAGLAASVSVGAGVVASGAIGAGALFHGREKGLAKSLGQFKETASDLSQSDDQDDSDNESSNKPR